MKYTVKQLRAMLAQIGLQRVNDLPKNIKTAFISLTDKEDETEEIDIELPSGIKELNINVLNDLTDEKVVIKAFKRNKPLKESLVTSKINKTKESAIVKYKESLVKSFVAVGIPEENLKEEDGKLKQFSDIAVLAKDTFSKDGKDFNEQNKTLQAQIKQQQQETAKVKEEYEAKLKAKDEDRFKDNFKASKAHYLSKVKLAKDSKRIAKKALPALYESDYDLIPVTETYKDEETGEDKERNVYEDGFLKLESVDKGKATNPIIDGNPISDPVEVFSYIAKNAKWLKENSYEGVGGNKKDNIHNANIDLTERQQKANETYKANNADAANAIADAADAWKDVT